MRGENMAAKEVALVIPMAAENLGDTDVANATAVAAVTLAAFSGRRR